MVRMDATSATAVPIRSWGLGVRWWLASCVGGAFLGVRLDVTRPW